MRVRAALAGLMCWLVPACAFAIDHDAYVWQRVWTDGVRAALAESRDDFRAVRILVAQSGRSGRWIETNADPHELAHDARKRIAVVRFDGAGEPPDAAQFVAYVTALAGRWQEAGSPLAGVEVDYDAGTRRLGAYATRLREIRARLPRELALSITALPAWLDSDALEDVLASVDEPVLQLHAVQNPARGLFDRALAERWVRAFAPHASHGFRVALPAYESRVRFDADGDAIAVENEMRVDAARSSDARDLRVAPADVVALLASLERAPPAGWHGVAWFRLPVPGDRRAWTLAALRDVMSGHTPVPRIEAHALAREGGASDIVVANGGAAGGPLPSLVVVGDRCAAADGANGWRVEPTADGWRFAVDPSRWLGAQTQIVAGWIRCASIETVRTMP
ncbi:MAG: DUF3142 domain-containing protein [Rhodanobacteraceae bacterium]